jgi:hypothetical protein
MATPFCAAACRLSVVVVAPPAVAQAPRPRRGLVAVRAEAAAGGGINPAIRKEEEKVVDTVLTGELAKPLTAYCRYGQHTTGSIFFPLNAEKFAIVTQLSSWFRYFDNRNVGFTIIGHQMCACCYFDTIRTFNTSSPCICTV